MKPDTASVISGILLALSFSSIISRAATRDEATDGDLSNTQSVPTMLSLTAGNNLVSGSVGGIDGQDWITLTVPLGFELSSLDLKVFDSTTDSTAFTGMSMGSVFTGSTLSAEDYLGYTHFGPGNVGTNLLPSLSTANLAQGFTPPLASGDYAFLIQQTGPVTTSYTFDYRVTAVPEVSGAALLGLGGLLLFPGRRRRRGSNPRAA
ncbi:MAG: hypothetical protein V4726_13185 [Verrucomicrobiota bacterium]